ncbi:type II toxin-antitoxin system prevent-host-death family antitoxin [Pendulispora albinea]|uniref:Antitoxin n=1 Tax=Pendulispora albinea TaxID=2741071 RepID=A0ABZ2LQU9_9BACT
MVDYRGKIAEAWKIADAKASLSELVREAERAPQRIENRGREVAYVVGAEEYRRLTDQAEKASDVARLRRFLQLSADLRAAGGADIKLPERGSRPSPFTSDDSNSCQRPAARP